MSNPMVSAVLFKRMQPGLETVRQGTVAHRRGLTREVVRQLSTAESAADKKIHIA